MGDDSLIGWVPRRAVRRTRSRPPRPACSSAVTRPPATARRSRGRGPRRARSTPCSAPSRGGRRRRGAVGRRRGRSSGRRRRGGAARSSHRSTVAQRLRRASASLCPVTRRPAASGSPRRGRAASALAPWSTAITMAPSAAASVQQRRQVGVLGEVAERARPAEHDPHTRPSPARQRPQLASSRRARPAPMPTRAASSAGSTGTAPPAGEASTAVQPTWRRASHDDGDLGERRPGGASPTPAAARTRSSRRQRSASHGQAPRGPPG